MSASKSGPIRGCTGLNAVEFVITPLWNLQSLCFFSLLSLFFLLLLKENTELNFSLPPQPASLSFLRSPTKVLIMLFPWCAVVFLHRAGIKCPSPCGRGSCIESILCLSCSNIISVTPRSFSPLRDVLPLMLLQWATGTSKTAFFFSFFF